MAREGFRAPRGSKFLSNAPRGLPFSPFNSYGQAIAAAANGQNTAHIIGVADVLPLVGHLAKLPRCSVMGLAFQGRLVEIGDWEPVKWLVDSAALACKVGRPSWRASELACRGLAAHDRQSRVYPSSVHFSVGGLEGCSVLDPEHGDCDHEAQYDPKHYLHCLLLPLWHLFDPLKRHLPILTNGSQ